MLDFTIHDYPILGSTNDEAKSLLKQGFGEGIVVKAQQQTQGRGRLGRQWISEPGNLYCSIVLLPGCSIVQAGQLSFVMAVAVGEAILPFLDTPQALSYKWPNDLLLQGEKVAGILIETESNGGQLAEACVVGIGINLHASPGNLVYPVTSISQHAKLHVSLDVLFSGLLDQVKNIYHIWKQEGFKVIREMWLQRVDKQGRLLTLNAKGGKVYGHFLDLSLDGALVFQDENGYVHKLISAEIL